MLWFLFLLVFVFYLLYSQLIANNLEFYSLLRKQKKCKQFAKYNWHQAIHHMNWPNISQSHRQVKIKMGIFSLKTNHLFHKIVVLFFLRPLERVNNIMSSGKRFLVCFAQIFSSTLLFSKMRWCWHKWGEKDHLHLTN